jgi:hypothetical protein
MLKDTNEKPNILNIKKEYKLSFKKRISPKIKSSISNWLKEL